MKSEPRNVLRDLLRDRGPELETNPQRVRALLTDLCPECRKEINLIVQAQQIEIPRRLKMQAAQLPMAAVLPTLSRLMEDHYGTSSEPARWAVESWAVALGMALPAPQPVPTPQPVTPPPTSTAAISTSAFWTLPYGEPVWVEIPAGEFWMGGERYDDEKPVHKVHLDRYWIAKTPITNTQYRLFVEATGREAPSHWENGKVPRGLESHPVVNVSWHDAMAYCKWLSEVTGKTITLPSEAQWEKAARGSQDQREYPWGASWKEGYCNSEELGVNGTTPVGIFPEGVSPYGALDLVGNVWEWCRTKWQDSYRQYRDDVDPAGDALRVVRGGAFYYSGRSVRCAYRGWLYPHLRVGSQGFRVVLSLSTL